MVIRHIRAKTLKAAFNKVPKTFRGEKVVTTSGKMEDPSEYKGMKLYKIVQVPKKRR